MQEESPMAAWPLHTIAYLHKEPGAMARSAFSGIAQIMQQPMPQCAFYFFINKGHSLLKAV